MTEALKSLYVPEDTVAAISTGDKLKEAFSEVTVSGDDEIENVEVFIGDKETISRKSHFNQTMPSLELDLESSSMCCNLPLVEWLFGQ